MRRWVIFVKPERGLNLGLHNCKDQGVEVLPHTGTPAFGNSHCVSHRARLGLGDVPTDLSASARIHWRRRNSHQMQASRLKRCGAHRCWRLLRIMCHVTAAQRRPDGSLGFGSDPLATQRQSPNAGVQGRGDAAPLNACIWHFREVEIKNAARPLG